MNAIDDPRVFMRSLATRQANLALSKNVQDAIDLMKVAGFDLVIVETSGIGQSDTEITEHCDVSLYVMTAEYGAATQLEKIDMLDFADVIAINKFDKRGSLDALRGVKKQFRRNHSLDVPESPSRVQHHRRAVRRPRHLRSTGTSSTRSRRRRARASSTFQADGMSRKVHIPPDRVRYLAGSSRPPGLRARFVKGGRRSRGNSTSSTAPSRPQEGIGQKARSHRAGESGVAASPARGQPEYLAT
jgi:methylmalonyl-CoA mutase